MDRDNKIGRDRSGEENLDRARLGTLGIIAGAGKEGIGFHDVVDTAAEVLGIPTGTARGALWTILDLETAVESGGRLSLARFDEAQTSEPAPISAIQTSTPLPLAEGSALVF